MTDYARMERHIRYRRIAQWARIVALLVMVPEIFEAVKYHFPAWDDIAMPTTLIVQQAASFVCRKTKMYEIEE